MTKDFRNESRIIMVFDSESIGFKKDECEITTAIKYDIASKSILKRDYSFAINNEQCIEQEDRDIIKRLVGNKINFTDVYSSNVDIDMEDIDFVEEMLWKEKYYLAKENGLCVKKDIMNKTKLREAILKKKKEIKEMIKKEGYVYDYEKLAYDFGYTICRYDRRTNKMTTFIKRSFLIKEVFTDMELMKGAYFFKNYPLYEDKLRKKKIELRPMQEIVNIMADDIDKYGVNVLSCYNASFDTQALKQTMSMLKIPNPRIPSFKKIKDVWCLWRMACDTLYDRPSFVKKALLKGWISNSGDFFTTNAEIGYRYIKNVDKFEEEHTALADAVIETEILEYILRQQKSKIYERNIIDRPYEKLRISRFFNVNEVDDKLTIQEIDRLFIETQKNRKIKKELLNKKNEETALKEVVEKIEKIAEKNPWA